MIFVVLAMAAAAPGADCTNVPLGCANAANLAAQIANPAELRVAAALSPALGAAPLAAIDRHTRGATLPLPVTDTDAAPK